MELYLRARGVLPFVFTFIRAVDQGNTHTKQKTIQISHGLDLIIIKRVSQGMSLGRDSRAQCAFARHTPPWSAREIEIARACADALQKLGSFNK